MEVVFNKVVQNTVEFHLFQIHTAMAYIDQKPVSEYTETDWKRMTELGFLRRGMMSFRKPPVIE
jgi:hypothetical protein